MKPKTGFQLVQAVLFMLAIMCGGLLLLPGSEVIEQAACLPRDVSAPAPYGGLLQLPASQGCPG